MEAAQDVTRLSTVLDQQRQKRNGPHRVSEEFDRDTNSFMSKGVVEFRD